jgi:transcriptional regulator with XRE-family HTH domain
MHCLSKILRLCFIIHYQQYARPASLRVFPRGGSGFSLGMVIEKIAVSKQEKEVGLRLGLIIQTKRRNARLYQAHVAKCMKHSQPWVARVESGRHNVTVEELLRLGECIGFDPARIIREVYRAVAIERPADTRARAPTVEFGRSITRRVRAPSP